MGFPAMVGKSKSRFPNPDLDLNPVDLATFVKSGGFRFGLDLNFFGGVDLDLNITGFAHHWFPVKINSLYIQSYCQVWPQG